jgi:hypothetical protein
MSALRSARPLSVVAPPISVISRSSMARRVARSVQAGGPRQLAAGQVAWTSRRSAATALRFVCTARYRPDRSIGLGGPSPRTVLALSRCCGHTVTLDRLIDELWIERPPDGLRTTMQTQRSDLRWLPRPRLHLDRTRRLSEDFVGRGGEVAHPLERFERARNVLDVVGIDGESGRCGVWATSPRQLLVERAPPGGSVGGTPNRRAAGWGRLGDLVVSWRLGRRRAPRGPRPCRAHEPDGSGRPAPTWGGLPAG